MFRNYTDCVRTFQDESPSSSYQDEFTGYVCDMCPEGADKYITETDVEIHRKRKHFREIVTVEHRERFCTVCMKLQPNYTSLIAHLKTEHLLSSPTAKRIEREIYICDYCNNIFFNKAILEIHIESKHLYDNMEKRRNRYFNCPKCLKTSTLVNVWFHFRQHDVPSVTVCDICIATFPNRTQLHEHIKSHPPVYRCDSCQYTTNKETLYNLHLDKHEAKVINQKRKVDKSVKRAFRMAKKDVVLSFNIHNLLKGLNLPNLLRICIICREMCTDKVDMREHVLRDHLFNETTEKIKYTCFCGEEFYNKILIKQHVFKLKGTHRILAQNELPETFKVRHEEEEISNDSLQENYTNNKLEIETENFGSADLNKNTNEQTLNTSNHVISTNKEDEMTNLIINTENLAKSGVIVITRITDQEICINNEDMNTTDIQKNITNNQIMTTDNQEMTAGKEEMITDNKKHNTGSETIASDNNEMTTDNPKMTTDNQEMVTDSHT